MEAEEVRARLRHDVPGAEPDVDATLVPHCTDRCPQHDGKRCRLLGHQPFDVCVPVVRSVVASWVRS